MRLDLKGDTLDHNPKFKNQHGALAELVRAGHGAINAVRMATGQPELNKFNDISDRRAQQYEQSVRAIIGNPQISDAAIHEQWTQMALNDSELRGHKNIVPFEELPRAEQIKVTAFRKVILDLIQIIL